MKIEDFKFAIRWTQVPLLLLAQLSSLHSQPASNRVLELDGQSSLDLPTTALQGLKEFTIETWVKPVQFGRDAIVLHIRSAVVESGFMLLIRQKAGAREYGFELRPKLNSNSDKRQPATAGTDIARFVAIWPF